MTERTEARRVAILAPMQPEFRPLVKAASLHRDETAGGDAEVRRGTVAGVEITAMMTGIGMESATRATERILDLGPCDHLVVVGIAGGIDPALRIGDVVVAEVVVDQATDHEYRATPLGSSPPSGRLVSSDVLLADGAEQAEMVRAGVTAVDMETAAVAAVCERRGVPWTAFRGISDRGVEDGVDSSVLELSQPDGTANLGAVAKYVVTKPWRLPTLARLGRNMQTAVRSAVDAALAALAETDPDTTPVPPA